MSSLPSHSDFVDEVKYKLKDLFESLPEGRTDIFYLKIKRCMELFWYQKRRQSGYQDSYYTWVQKSMPPEVAMTLIQNEVINSLEEARSNMGQYPAVASKFNSLYSYIQKQFGQPTHQVTQHGTSHMSGEIESLQQQVRGLQSQISALESSIKGFYTKNAGYDAAIGSLQQETAQLPSILQRLETLETPVKPPKSWFSRTKIKPSSTAGLETLLQKMNDLNA